MVTDHRLYLITEVRRPPTIDENGLFTIYEITVITKE